MVSCRCEDGVGVSERVHDASDQHRPLPGRHLPATAPAHDPQGGGRHRRHVAAGGRGVPPGGRQRARHDHRRPPALLRRGSLNLLGVFLTFQYVKSF